MMQKGLPFALPMTDTGPSTSEVSHCPLPGSALLNVYKEQINRQNSWVRVLK